MNKPFEILSHTADVGLRAYGADLPELYRNAARGMLQLIVEPGDVRPQAETIIEVAGADPVDLMITWLHEILFHFDARRTVFAEVCVEEVTPLRLRARLRGEKLDRDRHVLHMEIKAVTYHGARVEQTPQGWVAEVLFDI